MKVKLFCKTSAMQSGGKLKKVWILEPIAEESWKRDDVMGWKGSSDTNAMQVSLKFDSLEEAEKFAERSNYILVRDVIDLPEVSEQMTDKKYAKSYVENFSRSRRRPWTH